MGVAFALVSAVLYGAADFLGGVLSRRTPAIVVVALSQSAGLVVLGLALPFVPGRFDAGSLGWGIAAGVASAVGIGCLYAALARGRMGVVSPITAVVGASVPVCVGLLLGERPAAHVLAGVGFAFVAVALVSITPDVRGASAREPGVLLALVSGVGIGALYVFLSRGGPSGGLWLLAVTRVTSVALLALTALAVRQSLRPQPGSLGAIACAGALDMSANVLYVFSTRLTLLAVAAVLTSLYPASTVFLARIVLRERLSRVQWTGVACAIAGVVLIAWG
jgi:drug/metabolite transporter (DMT)-like permease